ncbi:hypothetical protein C8R44DRAFT_778552 [Mycena epipterygia]|nr:hypothetical protein C8R44DRAFT_778552 [Mycena epipterygia]
MPSPPRGYEDHPPRSLGAHHAPFLHRPMPIHANDPLYTFAPPDASSNFPEEGSTLRGQHKPLCDCCVSAPQTSSSVCADTASRDTTINGDNATSRVDTGGDTYNTARINGSTRFIIHGGQGGSGGEGGGIGGNGGAGQGNQLQFYLAGDDITLHVYHGSRDRDFDFVVDMAMCLAWLVFSTLALACLHHLGWFDIAGLPCA